MNDTQTTFQGEDALKDQILSEKIKPTFENDFPILTMKKEQSKSAENLSNEKDNSRDQKTDFQNSPQSNEEQKVENDHVNEEDEQQQATYVKKTKGISVFVRIKPSLSKQEQDEQKVLDLGQENKKIHLKSSNQTRTFSFNYIFHDNTTQETIFQSTCEHLINKLFDGFNVAILVYGQSGSGKTHTMIGQQTNNIFNIGKIDKQQRGIIPRVMDFIFARIWQDPNTQLSYDIRASYIEIYKEKIRDLLFPQKKNIKIYTESNHGLMISNATQVPITNLQQLLDLMEQGSKIRATAKTNINEHSSRSHAIVIITIFISNGQTGIKKGAQLYMADLAGSENVEKSKAQEEQIKEAGKINQSLLTLGNVIESLVEKRKYIPYRDSKLTRLMQNSFGGNSYTSIILTVSQIQSNYFETLTTLQFGDRANKIQNHPMSNQEYGEKKLKLMYDLACQKLSQQKQIIKKQQDQIDLYEVMIKKIFDYLDPYTQETLSHSFNSALIKSPLIPYNMGMLKVSSNTFTYILTFLYPQEVGRLFYVCKAFNQLLKSEYLWKIQLNYLRQTNPEFDYTNQNIQSYYLFFIKASKNNYLNRKAHQILSKGSDQLHLFKSIASKIN